MHAQSIEQSLEAVAEVAGDPSRQVYARLFAMAPELEPLFVRDQDGSVRAEMLQRAFETVMDLFGGGHYARGLIATEWVNHQNVGVPPAQFEWLFIAMIDAFRDILGERWTPEFDAAWAEVLARIRGIVAGLA